MTPTSNAKSSGFWWDVKVDSWRVGFHTIRKKDDPEHIADYVFSGSFAAFENDLVLFKLAMVWV